MSNLRKALTYVLTISTIVWGVGLLAVPVAVGEEVAAGSVVKAEASPNLYEVALDGETINQYMSWGDYTMWNNPATTTINTVDISGYTLGDPVGLRTGALIKVASSPKVYLVKNNGKIAWIEDEAAYAGLGYQNWGYVYIISQASLDRYLEDTSITTGTDTAGLREGTIIKYQGSPEVYYVQDSKKRWITNEDAFYANYPSWDLLITIPDTEEYTTGDPVTGADSTINTPGSKSEGGEVTPTPVTTGALSVSLAATSPATAYVPYDAEGQVFTVVNLTNGNDAVVDVTGLTIKRMGANGDRNDFTRLYAVYNGARISSLKSISTQDEASLTFSLAPSNKISIAIGDTVAVSVAATMSDDANDTGHANSLSVTAVATSATVSGLPITGNSMSIGGIAAVTVTSTYQGSSKNVNIGDQNVELGRVKILNNDSTRDITVSGLRLKNTPSSGTAASSTDVGEFSLYISGESTAIATATMDTDKYINFQLASPVAILKGGSNYKVFIVKTATIASGPTEIVRLVFNQTSDITATDDLGNRTDNTAPSGTAATYTIAGGTLTIATATDTPKTANILANTDNIEILRATLTARQGKVDVTQLTVDLIGTMSGDPDRLKIVVEDSAGASIHSEELTSVNVNATEHATLSLNTFSDSVTDLDGVYTIKVTIDTASGATGNIYAKMNSGTSDLTATRQADDAAVTSTGTATGRVFTIAAPTLTLSASTTPGSKTRVKGELNVPFMGFDMKAANDASTVTVNSIVLTLIGDDGSTAQTITTEEVQNVKLTNADGTVVYAESPTAATATTSATYTFDTFTADFPTAINTQGIKVVVYADVAQSVTSGVTRLYFKVNATSDVDAVDVNNNSATVSGTPNSGGTYVVTAVDRGTLNVEALTNDVKAAQILSYSTGIEIGRFKFTADQETVTVKQLDFTITTGSDADIAKVELYNLTTGKSLALDYTIVSNKAVFTALNTGANALAIAPGTSNAQTLSVIIDTNTVDDAQATSGHSIAASLADLATDVEADGATQDVYGAVTGTTGNGITLTATGDTTTLGAAIASATATTITVAASGSLAVGKLIAVGTEYMLITSVASSTSITVRRGVAGSTAATASNGAAVTEYTQVLAGNTMKLYAAKVAIEEISLAGVETLKNTGSSYMDAFKFKITPDASSERDVVLNGVTVSILGQYGIGLSSDANAWYITAIKIVNSDGTDITSSGTDSSTTDMQYTTSTVAFSGLARTIAKAGETFIVQAMIAGTVAGGTSGTDKIELGINSLGTSSAAGDLDWDDTKSTAITWVDQADTKISGGMITE